MIDRDNNNGMYMESNHSLRAISSSRINWWVDPPTRTCAENITACASFHSFCISYGNKSPIFFTYRQVTDKLAE